jgi:hypothetical protein
MRCQRHDVHERTIATESGHKRWLRVAGRSDRRGGIQPLVGVAIDLVRVSGLGRLMRSTLYGIDTLDVASFEIVAIADGGGRARLLVARPSLGPCRSDGRAAVGIIPEREGNVFRHLFHRPGSCTSPGMASQAKVRRSPLPETHVQ